ncbi:MAG: arginine--tRNA ligase [Phycisphaerales bacterium JB043]
MSLHDPVSILTTRFQEAIRAALGDKLQGDADPLLGPSRNPAFGDFQSNAAMPLGKQLGMKPREIASAILEHLRVDDICEALSDESIAGPGFINIRLRPEALASMLEAMDTPELGVESDDHMHTIVVDLCGVNLAKQMHVGHLRATVIGDAIARVHERLGWNVIRQNHLGDWGLPIAMVVRSVQDALDEDRIELATLSLDDLDSIYREAQRACKPDTRGLQAVERFDLGPKALAELEEQVDSANDALARAKETLIALQSGDERTTALWQSIVDITLDACLALCAQLHARVTHDDTAGESTYRHELGPLVDDLLQRGVATLSDGATIVPLDDVAIDEPCLIRKSDGGFLYATTDMAAIRRRVQSLGASRVVYCVDARQSLHFRQVFAASLKAGYATLSDGTNATLHHAAFGTVLGEDNRPFKTRSGENVKLSDLLDEAEQRALVAIAEKNPDLPESERQGVASAIGMSAIKYADLASDRIKDYVFSFDRMLAFEGDTGPYLLYALVRIRSILRRAREQRGLDVDSILRGAPPLSMNASEEKQLALKLLRYPDALRSSADALEPHRLCTYVYELAGTFSSFFQQCPVLKAPDEPTLHSRLRLCSLTGRVLEDAITTLGLVPLERM